MSNRPAVSQDGPSSCSTDDHTPVFSALSFDNADQSCGYVQIAPVQCTGFCTTNATICYYEDDSLVLGRPAGCYDYL